MAVTVAGGGSGELVLVNATRASGAASPVDSRDVGAVAPLEIATAALGTARTLQAALPVALGEEDPNDEDESPEIERELSLTLIGAFGGGAFVRGAFGGVFG